MTRESLAIQVENRLPNGKGTFDWPEGDAVDGQERANMHDKLELSTFQAEYIDIIPQNWNVVSMTLSQERDEILISKMRSGQTPFILRLPLNRHNSLDQDDETFGYDQGKAELQDIIRLADISTRSAQDFSHKGAKTEWWEGRATLDARLRDLLNNMEAIWLGGFKAIFSQTAQVPTLLSRFQQSFHNILDKHLPSRQKSGRGGQSDRVALDPRVLELFTGLGTPSDSNDLDEPLVDLLYFVVDILQFNGERNAYDEVDFDAVSQPPLNYGNRSCLLTSYRSWSISLMPFGTTTKLLIKSKARSRKGIRYSFWTSIFIASHGNRCHASKIMLCLG